MVAMYFVAASQYVKLVYDDNDDNNTNTCI